MKLAQGLDQLLLLFRCAENVQAVPQAVGISKRSRIQIRWWPSAFTLSAEVVSPAS